MVVLSLFEGTVGQCPLWPSSIIVCLPFDLSRRPSEIMSAVRRDMVLHHVTLLRDVGRHVINFSLSDDHDRADYFNIYYY